MAPRRLQFFSFAFFRVATRRLMPVIWLPSMSTPFRLAPNYNNTCLKHDNVGPQRLWVRFVMDYLPGWPSVQMDLQNCILWEKLPQRWNRASSPLVSWRPSRDKPNINNIHVLILRHTPQESCVYSQNREANSLLVIKRLGVAHDKHVKEQNDPSATKGRRCEVAKYQNHSPLFTSRKANN